MEKDHKKEVAMKRTAREQATHKTRMMLLREAAEMFLQNGYSATTIKALSLKTGLPSGSITNLFANKEELVCQLIGIVVDYEYKITESILTEVTDDPLLRYAFAATLQLNMAETSEHMREMYWVTYSLDRCSALIHDMLTVKLEETFRDYLPTLERKDFYEREIATAGIIRGFMAERCDLYFTMERKVRAFLETNLLIYRVPDEKIAEAIDFVLSYDMKSIGEGAVSGMLSYMAEHLQ